MTFSQKYVQRPEHAIAAATILPLFDLVAVALRFWTRKKQRQDLKADDWLMIPALLLVWGIAIAIIWGVSQKAVGYPEQIPKSAVAYPQMTLILQIDWAYSMLLPLAVGCIKCSILFFYMRIFTVDKRGAVNIVLATLIVLVALMSVAFCIATMFECRLDFWAIWGPTKYVLAHCVEPMDIVLGLCIADFVSDVAIICAPIPLVWRLRLSTKKRLAVTAAFLLGSGTIVASLLRLIMTSRITRMGLGQTEEDCNFVITEYLYWGMIESGIGILAACLPTLQFLLRGWSGKSTISTTRSQPRYRISFSSYTKTSDESFQPMEPLQATRDEPNGRTNPSYYANWENRIASKDRFDGIETHALEAV